MKLRWVVVLVVICACSLAAQEQPIVLRASTLIDGTGHVMHDTGVVVQGGKIVKVGPQSQWPSSATAYDLSHLTVLPGFAPSLLLDKTLLLLLPAGFPQVPSHHSKRQRLCDWNENPFYLQSYPLKDLWCHPGRGIR